MTRTVAALVAACLAGPALAQTPVSSAPGAPAIARPGDRTAVVGVLDKRTGRAQDFTLKPGQNAAYGPLAIRLATCERTPPWVSPRQSGAFVQVDERVARPGAPAAVRRVFSGWLFAESPSLNAMRHPVFDVWLKSCTMSFPDGPAPPADSAKKSAPARTAPPSKAT